MGPLEMRTISDKGRPLFIPDECSHLVFTLPFRFQQGRIAGLD